MKKLFVSVSLLVLLAGGEALAAEGSCASIATLNYVGRTSDSSTSLWLLSREFPGSWELRDNGATVKDTTTGQGINFMFSDVVASGAAGEHGAYEVSGDAPCLANTALQEGGLVIDGGGNGGDGGGEAIGIDDIVHSVRQSGLATALHRSYTISDRISTGLVAEGGPKFEDDFQVVSMSADLSATENNRPPLSNNRIFNLNDPWSVWVRTSYYDVADDRFNRDTDGDLLDFVAGVDYLHDNDLVTGVTFGVETAEMDGFSGTVETDYTGYSVGIYAGYEIFDNVVLDGWFGYAYEDYDSRIDVLYGEFTNQRLYTSWNITTQADLGFAKLLPKYSFYYSNDWTEDYDYTISGSGTAFDGETIRMTEGGDDYGVMEFSLELNETYHLGQVTELMPYVYGGMRYEFDQTNGGRVLGGDLTMEEVDPWMGQVKMGLRSLVGEQLVVEAGIGYLGIGQTNYDVWNANLSVSMFF